MEREAALLSPLILRYIHIGSDSYVINKIGVKPNQIHVKADNLKQVLRLVNVSNFHIVVFLVKHSFTS